MLFNRSYTHQEIQFIKDNYLTMTSAQIAEVIGRSEKSVMEKKWRLGLYKNKKWRKSEIEILKSLGSITIKEAQIIFPEKEYCTLIKKLQQLGLYKKEIKGKYKHIYVNGKNRQEHRYIVEQNIGRQLTKEEIIHHINCDSRDNRIENLEICTNAEHMKAHHSMNKIIKFLLQEDIIQFKNKTYQLSENFKINDLNLDYVWSNEQDDILKKYYGKISIEKIAAIVNKTSTGVAYRIKSLGLKDGYMQEWSENDQLLLLENINKPNKELYKIFTNRTKESIRRKANTIRKELKEIIPEDN